jgi:hypothetical protein
MTARALFALALFLCLSAAGCGGLDSLTKSVDDAIQQIGKTTGVFEAQSKQWQTTLNGLADKLKASGQDLLADDLRNYSTRVIGDGGAEFRCNVDFVRNRIRESLQNLKNALLKKATSFSQPPPAICQVGPASIDMEWLNHETFHVKSILRTVEADGYDFKAENSGLALSVVGQDGKERDETRTISVTTPYKLQVTLGETGVKFQPFDTKLILRSKEKLSEIPITWNARPAVLTPPPPPRVASVIVRVNTTRDDKDREIRFTYSVRKGNDVIASITVGNGEVWRDPSTRDFTIVIPDAKKFTEAERFNYSLHVRYDSSSGDPRWIGNVGATLVFDRDRPTLETLTTGDFEMGHHDKGKHPERIDQDFKFNK